MTKPKTPVHRNPKDIAPQSKAMELKQWRLYKPSLLKDPVDREDANEKLAYRVYRELVNAFAKDNWRVLGNPLERAKTKSYAYNVWFCEVVNELLCSESKHISRPILKHVRAIMKSALEHARQQSLDQLVNVSPKVYHSRARYTELFDLAKAIEEKNPEEAIEILRQIDPRIQMGIACGGVAWQRLPLTFVRLMAAYAMPSAPYFLASKKPSDEDMLTATKFFVNGVKQQWGAEWYSKTNMITWDEICKWSEKHKHSVRCENYWNYTREEWEKVIRENEKVPN